MSKHPPLRPPILATILLACAMNFSAASAALGTAVFTHLADDCLVTPAASGSLTIATRVLMEFDWIPTEADLNNKVRINDRRHAASFPIADGPLVNGLPAWTAYANPKRDDIFQMIVNGQLTGPRYQVLDTLEKDADILKLQVKVLA